MFPLGSLILTDLRRGKEFVSPIKKTQEVSEGNLVSFSGSGSVNGLESDSCKASHVSSRNGSGLFCFAKNRK